MVWCALVLSFVSLALSVWSVLRRPERQSRESHIEIPPAVVQHETEPPERVKAWERFDAEHKAAFMRAVEARRIKAAKRREVV